jgi:hypothetical protein
MSGESNEERREKLVTRFVNSRILLEKCVSDVTPDSGWSGSEWSVGDLIAHLTESYYQDTARRIINEDNPQIGYDQDKDWKRRVDQALHGIEDALSIARRLTTEQMSRAGGNGNSVITVLDALELAAAHFEEHLTQLRDEVRPREGFPVV